ncbi:MAG: gamma carbonic anhydrase family protein [Elusimicrobia bacterium]|nr:gamma carbonic anhydrase family protein [Elusimicrobiota bacterium]
MIRSYKGKAPKIHPKAYVHPSAEVIGDVELAAGVTVLPLCVLRADVDRIVVGANTNVQDGAIIHCDRGMPTIIGKGVTIGHRALIHGAKIGDHVLLGMGSIILAAKIGNWSLIGAGALVLNKADIPAKSFVRGFPAKVIRKVNAKAIAAIKQGEKAYLNRQKDFRTKSFVIEL